MCIGIRKLKCNIENQKANKLIKPISLRPRHITPPYADNGNVFLIILKKTTWDYCNKLHKNRTNLTTYSKKR